jgi:hypothetical protein
MTTNPALPPLISRSNRFISSVRFINFTTNSGYTVYNYAEQHNTFPHNIKRIIAIQDMRSPAQN